MAAKRRTDSSSMDLLRTMLIAQLGLVGVPQQNIRAIVGCDIVRVNDVVKNLRSKATKKTTGRA